MVLPFLDWTLGQNLGMAKPFAHLGGLDIYIETCTVLSSYLYYQLIGQNMHTGLMTF